MINSIYNMDCLEGMKLIDDNSIDFILCDLPYGTTQNSWDSIIPLKKMWEQYLRIIKDNAAIVLTANGAFTHKLIASKDDLYKYKWIWVKNTASNPMNAKNRPMVSFEEILVFSKGVTANACNNRMNYYPQGLVKINKELIGKRESQYGGHVHDWNAPESYIQEFTNYPRDVLKFDQDKDTFHPTQKPLSLFEYLIKTYTKKGDLVLDNCMGSGTTAIACINTDRNYIGFETDEGYYKKSLERIKSNVTQLSIF